MSPPRWMSSIRGRLTLVFGSATLIVAVLGAVILTGAMDAGLQASTDGLLRMRAEALAADVAAGNIEGTDAPSQVSQGTRGLRDVQAFSIVYGPDGRLAESTPSPLPTPPASVRSSNGTLTRDFAGVPFRIRTDRVRGPGGTWTIVVGAGVRATAADLVAVETILAGAVPVATVLSAIGAWVLAGAALRPVERMRRDAARLGEHDPSGRVGVPATKDSLADLAATFNGLLDRQNRSLDRQRGLVADAGHELRTPLAVLKVELATALLRERPRHELIDAIEHAQNEVTHLCALADDLLLLAQGDGRSLHLSSLPTNAGALIADAVRAHSAAAAMRGVRIVVTTDSDLVGQMDRRAMRRVLDNLLSNAVHHAATPGTVEVHGMGEQEVLTITVLDDGDGFPAAFLPFAFDRFRRADQARSRVRAATGSGLGLAIAQSLVRAQGGEVTARNRALPASGGQVTVTVPREPPNASGRSADARNPVPHAASRPRRTS